MTLVSSFPQSNMWPRHELQPRPFNEISGVSLAIQCIPMGDVRKRERHAPTHPNHPMLPPDNADGLFLSSDAIVVAWT